jgi:hypothetical protein
MGIGGIGFHFGGISGGSGSKFRQVQSLPVSSCQQPSSMLWSSRRCPHLRHIVEVVAATVIVKSILTETSVADTVVALP